jgi:hypothetical protein
VALGASNLTLGFSTVLATARSVWGKDVEVLAALGYGRSYGAASTIAMRTLPGILQSGLWAELARLPERPTRALITDVGNDILYGETPGQILAWVEEAADRLQAHAEAVVLTDLPVENIRRLSPATFLFFRSLFFPPCRLDRHEVFERVEQLNAGVTRLAKDRGFRLVHLRRDWYSFDPIHLRPLVWSRAWRDIIVGESPDDLRPRFAPLELLRVHTLPPERRSLFGIERVAPQQGRPLRRGGRLWIY